MNSASQLRLAAAHATLAVLALVALIAVWWLPKAANGAPPGEEVRQAAMWFRIAASSYLLATFLSEAYQARRLRIAQVIESPPIALPAGHLWVILVTVAVIARGSSSRAMLAGCDAWIAVLLAIGSLALLLALVTWWFSRKFAATERLGEPLKGRWLTWFTSAVALLVVVSLWYLETRSL
jgi:hypothetical protein